MQYGVNKYLLTGKYLLATMSSKERFLGRESIGVVKIKKNMNRKKLLIRLTSGALQNVSFEDMINLIKAKPYQIRQLLTLVEKYNLRLEDEQ